MVGVAEVEGEVVGVDGTGDGINRLYILRNPDKLGRISLS